MENKKERPGSAYKLNPILFWPMVIIMVMIIALSFINQEGFAAVVSAAVNSEVVGLKWTVGPIILFLIATMIWLLVSPIGQIRLGGPDATPRFGRFSYWGLCLCSTIAIGVVLWGVAQPITYFMEPAIGWGVDPGTDAAAIKAIAQTNLEWAVGQYTQYAIFAIAIGLAAYNFKQPMKTSSFLYMITGKPVNKALNIIVDLICLFGIVAGVTCSLGTGTMQMSAGLQAVFGIDVSKITWLVVEACVVVGFLLMSINGIAKGIRIVTDQNLRLYYVVMVIIIILGPTQYIFDMLTESSALMVQTFVESVCYTGGINGDTQPIFWMIWLFVSTAAFAPITGLFLAKASYGKTIREIVVGNFIFPAIFNIAWFVIFGAAAIYKQQTGEIDIWGMMQTLGTETASFEFFKSFPLGMVLCVVFLVVIYLSFVTMASGSTTSAAIVSMTLTREVSEEEEPPMWMKVVWALIMAVSAYVFISFAGIEGAKSMALIGGMPSMLLHAVAAVAVWRARKLLKLSKG